MTGEVRDLRDNTLLPATALLGDGEVVKTGFTPTRWEALVADVAFFRSSMGGLYRNVLRDYGYNPTPLWTMIGGSLANLVPAGSNAGIRALSALDPLIELAMFAAIGWAFGVEIALISMIYFCLLFGASFGWLGGAFLRHLWLASLIGSACLMHKQRYATSGALLALSAMLRVFPIFFALGPLAGLAYRWRRGEPCSDLFRFASGLLVAGAILLTATSITPRGWESWIHFNDNMQRHVQNIAFNTVGLTNLLQPLLASLPSSFATELDKSVVHRLQLFTVFPLALGWLFVRAQKASPLEALALGAVPLFVALDLACYYYVAMLLLVFVQRDRPLGLALLFAAETVSYVMLLFEDRDAVIFVYRDVTVLVLLLLILVVRPVVARRSPAPA